MDRISFEIDRQDVADALQAQADAHGRTVEEEVAALVEMAFVPGSRVQLRRAPDYPPGLEPLADEGFGTWLHRISRPGFDLEIERDKTPHHGIEL